MLFSVKKQFLAVKIMYEGSVRILSPGAFFIFWAMHKLISLLKSFSSSV